MPKYLIERVIPGLGQMSERELQGLSQQSCKVLSGMGPDTQWVESFVTNDKLYCVYYAPDVEAIREHARRGEFPCNQVSQVEAMIDPTTAEN
ncbi:MAG TPA: DUF4242 domain-containing protein [Trueperaceae bacterium]